MYIDKLIDENVGPIEKATIAFPFNEEGLPKPIILVGENGSGKSTLLSNIVDALYSIAAKKFQNAMCSNDNGIGHQYYKAILPAEIKVDRGYMFSYVLFKNTQPIHYVFKSGELSATKFKEKCPPCMATPFKWQDKDNFKGVHVAENDVEDIFNTDAICYFGPDRYEKPFWMGDKYFDHNSNIHPSIQENWAGVLKNPITVRGVTDINLQWLLDVIVDSRFDMRLGQGGLQINQAEAINLLALGNARRNLEIILSKILGKEVYFLLKHRNSGPSRFVIAEHNTNRVIAPTLDSLSTGQISLFNMFSTIVRYADSADLNKSILLNEISGIVVIDEIELHLHATLQKEVLPKLLKLFPKVQFIITSHSPLFLLGMQQAFGDDGYEVYEMPSATKISVERFSQFKRAYEYFKATETYQKDAEAAIAKAKSNLITKTLVITEGATDWMLMKVAMAELKKKPEHAELFSNLDFDFFEFGPKNSQIQTKYKVEMGNSTLVSICKNYEKLPKNEKYVFIADCDVESTNKEMRDGKVRFKRWKNKVYSFTIPVPIARSTTPNISIEHLFADSEIKTEVLCDDGVPRRLYMGNEFNKYGHSLDGKMFCERADICGPNKINIIEGSQGNKVHSFNECGIENYALSKMRFANYVKENPCKFNFDNFVEIFKTIKEIVEDDAPAC